MSETPSITIPAEHRNAVLMFGEIASMNASSVKDKLFNASEIIGRANPFYRDQIITPREGYSYANAGIPHIVVKTMKLERNRLGWGSPTYGKQADMLVAFMTQAGEIMTAWVESYAFERWNDERHGTAFDARADKARADLDNLKQRFDQSSGEVVAFAPRAPATVEDESAGDSIKVVGDGDGGPATVETDQDGASTYEQPGPTHTPGPADDTGAVEPVLKPGDDANAVDAPHPADGAAPPPALPGA